MFWSGNYLVVRELNCLLKEENVTLTQVLEADDILQECQADNKALMQFLTKPNILAELITLITEEPPKNVELASQYRHASIACEVLTSHLSTLSDRLSMDVVQMNRLCDFINRDPPLNPLLASYFSKTVEMLLERSPKQAWYTYHMVCLRVLDFFKSRRDFLPNLLRHISTSAIADTFKYFIRLDDLFNKIIMEWFEEHQFLECLIQIICGTYVPEPLAKGPAAGASPDLPEKGQLEPSEKAHANHDPHDHHEKEGVENNVEETKEASEPAAVGSETKTEAVSGVAAGAEATVEAAAEAEMRATRIAAVASANAAALLCDLILSGCAGDGYNTRARTSWALVARLARAGAAALLAGMFTAPPPARRHALVHGAHVLLALMDHEPNMGGEYEAERTSVECAIAPHLPLLHQALLQPPAEAGAVAGGVGLARVQVAALLAHLATSEVHDVCATMITLRTPAVVLDLMFSYEHNNFMHAQAHALVRHALANRVYRTQYARHLLVECDLLTRLMDAYEENENKMAGSPRSGYMGHVTQMLRCMDRALQEDPSLEALLPPAVGQRRAALRDRLVPALQRLDTPLGGYYPSENAYEFNECGAPGGLDDGGVPQGDDAREIGGSSEPTEFLADEIDIDDNEKIDNKGNFLELASQRFSDDMWEDSPAADAEAEAGADECPIDQVMEVLAVPSPWEGAAGGAGGGEGWAQFDAPQPSACFWPFASDENSGETELSPSMATLSLGDSARLATKLLTAMADMPPHLYAALCAQGQVPFEGDSSPGDAAQTVGRRLPDGSVVENSTVQNSTIQHSTVMSSTIINSTLQRSSIQVSTVINSTTQNSTLENVTAINSRVQNQTLQNVTVVNWPGTREQPAEIYWSPNHLSIQNDAVRDPSEPSVVSLQNDQPVRDQSEEKISIEKEKLVRDQSEQKISIEKEKPVPDQSNQKLSVEKEEPVRDQSDQKLSIEKKEPVRDQSDQKLSIEKEEPVRDQSDQKSSVEKEQPVPESAPENSEPSDAQR